MPHSGYMEAVGLCSNGPPTDLESPHSAAPPTETPPPGYMSEDGDPIDPNDNMSNISFNHLTFYCAFNRLTVEVNSMIHSHFFSFSQLSLLKND